MHIAYFPSIISTKFINLFLPISPSLFSENLNFSQLTLFGLIYVLFAPPYFLPWCNALCFTRTWRLCISMPNFLTRIGFSCFQVSQHSTNLSHFYPSQIHTHSSSPHICVSPHASNLPSSFPEPLKTPIAHISSRLLLPRSVNNSRAVPLLGNRQKRAIYKFT